ncbi:MAG: hypothetical protein J6T30_00465 [Bacteroidales bacterium]|nr:hypothetical protein [Bacteroidales bacterium]
MRKINILLAILLTLCTTGCIFKIMEDFSEPTGYVFFFKNDSSKDLYVEIVRKSTKDTIEKQLNIGEERFFLGRICRRGVRGSDIYAIFLYSDSTKNELIYFESLYDTDHSERKIIGWQWKEEIQLDVGLAKEYFEDYKDIEELYKLTFTFTDEFLEEVRE